MSLEECAPDEAKIAAACLNSLFMHGGGYTIRTDGSLEYKGDRPDGGWHIHGWLARWLWIFLDGELRRRRLFKRRWLDPKAGHTVHSRPPDELGAIHFCGVVVAIALWPWLNGGLGVHCSEPVVDDLREGRPSDRTVQRWLKRGLPYADKIQQRIRSALIERCEPRPVEDLFPRGLSPPEGLSRRRWRKAPLVHSLWRALAILFVGAVGLALPTAILLAEARGR